MFYLAEPVREGGTDNITFTMSYIVGGKITSESVFKETSV